MSTNEAAYAKLATSIQRLRGNVDEFSARMVAVEELNDGCANLALIFGSMFSSVQGCKEWIQQAGGEAVESDAQGAQDESDSD